MKLNPEKQSTQRPAESRRMFRRRFAFKGLLLLLTLIAALGASGCATHRGAPARIVLPDDGENREAVSRAQQTIANLFPPRYRATQRAIISVGRQQFTCDGVLTASPGEGYHLAVVSNLGTVTDLRVKADGACELLKVTPLFRESWSRQFVAQDLRWLFVPPADLKPAGRFADGRLVLQTDAGSDGPQARYVFAAPGERWQELELIRNGRSYYRATVRRYCAFAGVPGEFPCEFEVTATTHRLYLRMAELSVSSAPKTEAPP
jgi:hypothetical protein